MTDTMSLTDVHRQIAHLGDLPADQRRGRAAAIATNLDTLTDVAPETMTRLWIQLGRRVTGRPVAAGSVATMTPDDARRAALDAIGSGNPLGEVARAAAALAEAEATLRSAVTAAKRAGCVVEEIRVAARLKTRQTVYDWARSHPDVP